MKKETVGKDLKDFIDRTIKDTAANHLDAWKERYAEQTRVSDVRFDLRINHDNSLEIEYAEQELNRKLNDKETEFLVDKFHSAVCKQCKNYLDKVY